MSSPTTARGFLSKLASFFRAERGRSLLLIALIVLPLFFFKLGSWAFFDADEGRYGAIPREMVASGDYITPTLNHIKFFDKPPLLYWGIAAGYQFFGFHEWAARLIPALAALMGVLFAWRLGAAMFGERVGRWSALILSSCLLWPLLSRVVLTDMLVSSLVFVTLALWWLGANEKQPRRQTAYFLGFWAALALAVLAKGPVTVVMVGGSLFLYCLLCRQWSTLRQMRALPGAALFLLIAAPWFVAVGTINPEFNHYFWYDQHIARFMGDSISGADHITGPFYYFKLLPLVFFPWTFFVPAAIVAAWIYLKEKSRSNLWASLRDDAPTRNGVFLLCVIAFIFAFFSSTSSKLITYLLPILPPTAILLGAYFGRMTRLELDTKKLGARASRIAAWALVGVLIALAIAGLLRGAHALAKFDVGSGMVGLLCFALVVWAIAVGWAACQRGVSTLVPATSFGFATFFVSLLFLIAAIAPQFTTPSLLAVIAPGIEAGAEVDTLPYTQSVGFYIGKRVEMLGSASELEFGIRHMSPADKAEWVVDKDFGESPFEDLKRDMASEKPIYFVVRKSSKNKKLLKKLSIAPTAIVENQRFQIIGNAAALRLTPPVN